MSVQYPHELTSIPYYISATFPKGQNEHSKSLREIVLKSLNRSDEENAKNLVTTTSWDIPIKDLTKAFEVLPILMQHHTWLHERQCGVEVFLRPVTNDLNIKKQVLKIGASPPTPNDLENLQDVYYIQYLPDHSLSSTRLIHTLATVAGVSAAFYGVFSDNWTYIPAGIAFIYGSGFLAHLFSEKNIPSSTKYPLGSVYSDLRVTLLTLLSPITNHMNHDLEKAGIYDVTKKCKQE